MHRPPSLSPPPRGLRLFAALTGALTALAWGAALLAPLLHWPFPYDWPFFPIGTSLFDFDAFFERFQLLHTSGFFFRPGYPFSYFAPGVPLYEGFYSLGEPADVIVYLTGSFFVGIGSLWVLRRSLIRTGLQQRHASGFVAIAGLCAYPILFGLERGNLEFLLAAGVALGLLFYCKGKPYAAAFLWGVFGSVKLYPLLLAALFLSYRQYRALAVSLLTAISVTLLSLWYCGPTFSIAYHGIQNGIAAFLSSYTLTARETCWDHSLFSVVKLLPVLHGVSPAHLLTAYLFIAGTTMLLVYAVRIRKLPLANRVLVLSVSMALLPPTSFDYTLVQLYGAWAILVLLTAETSVRKQYVRGLTVTLGIFAAALSPSNLIAFGGHAYGGQAKCLMLVALLVAGLAYPFDSPATLPAHDSDASGKMPL